MVDSAVSGFSNDFKNEHQSISIHYDFEIDYLVNQLQYTATASHQCIKARRLGFVVKP